MPLYRPRIRPGLLLTVLLGLYLILVISAELGWKSQLLPQTKLALLAFTTMIFGACVGAAEIQARYRDEPFRALATGPAVAYLLLNAMISLASFALLLRYRTSLIPGLRGDLVLTSFAAGFGGMLIARSKLFSYQGESGNEYSFGPAIVLESFLKSLDRKIDRMRSTQRQERVFNSIKEMKLDPEVFDFALAYLEGSLQSYQNLSQQEKTDFAKVIHDYRGLEEWPPIIRLLAAGFAVLNLCGEDNFDQVMKHLKEALLRRTQAPPAPPFTPPPPSP